MRLFFVPFAFLIGCNALTGASDLEEVPCTIDCTDATTTDVAIDTLDVAVQESAAPDTSVLETMAIDDGKCMLDNQCNDGNACTKDTCSAGSCTTTKIDDDGDDESPIALGTCGLDCNDQNKQVSTKQTEWFSEGYPIADADAGTDAGTVSFDYDCNGVEEKERNTTYKCTYSGGKCTISEGWSGSPPACGANGTYVVGCTVMFGSLCQPTLSSKSKQRCH